MKYVYFVNCLIYWFTSQYQLCLMTWISRISLWTTESSSITSLKHWLKSEIKLDLIENNLKPNLCHLYFMFIFLLFWFSHLFLCCVIHTYASLVAQIVKNLPAMQETWVQSLCWEDPLEECLAIHSSIPAWRIAMDRRAWQATVHGVTELDTTEWLSTAHIYLHVFSFHWYIFILNRVLLPIFFNVENNQVWKDWYFK